MIPPASGAIDIRNQKVAPRGESLPGTLAIVSVITGTIPAISAFMERNSGMKVIESERLNDPPAMSRMKSD